MAADVKIVKGVLLDDDENADWIKKVATAKNQLTPGEKAAQTRKWRAAAAKAQKTLKWKKAFVKSKASEAASKEAFSTYCEQNGWRAAFFEGATGAPRNGIIDAIAFRLVKGNCDALDVRLVQLKSGKAGVNGAELKRLKAAVSVATVSWLTATYDGEEFHFSPDDPIGPKTGEAMKKWKKIKANRDAAKNYSA